MQHDTIQQWKVLDTDTANNMNIVYMHSYGCAICTVLSHQTCGSTTIACMSIMHTSSRIPLNISTIKGSVNKYDACLIRIPLNMSTIKAL